MTAVVGSMSTASTVPRITIVPGFTPPTVDPAGSVMPPSSLALIDEFPMKMVLDEV